MEFEFNPFQLNVSTGVDIQSITVNSNLDWFSVPATPLSGEAVVLEINAKTDVAAYKVFGTGSATGTPAMRSLLAGHIPNIEMTQVNGLQSAINSILKSLASANSFLSVNNNGSGDYTLTVNTGTTGTTVAAGNDSRFPASVTGLRKGAGVGSLDTAAVARTDYWDGTVFVASGASHAKGLVPDPGASAGTAKYLREDATWATPAGTGTVTSVALTMPAEFSVTGSPITTAGTLAVAKANQSANLVFAGPATGAAAAPTFRAQVYADISSLVGTAASTIASGNDTRFPASVTGLRKSSGAGSTDVAAVLYTDYWNNTVFGGKGPSHSIGLVPDPGAGAAPYTRYLRDDGTWQTFVPDTGTIANSMLATMSAKTLKANATAGTASPTDVDAKTARSSSLLNIEAITTFGDANYTALSTDRYISTSAALTAQRTVTLPLANTFNAGQSITVADDFGGINGANTLLVARSGADTIQGKTTPVLLDIPRCSITLRSNGSNAWSVERRVPAVRRIFYTGNATYTTSTGVKALFVEGVAGGGGGGGAVAAASNAAVGAGGGGGGYANILITNPATSYSVVIGAGGAGGVGNASGATGGVTTFGGVLQADPGSGGASLASGTASAFTFGFGGAGGGATSGDWWSQGSDGGVGIRLSGTVAASGSGGKGAVFGGDIAGLISEGNGLLGARYGSGGSGAVSFSTTSRTGGAGMQGILIITEYY